MTTQEIADIVVANCRSGNMDDNYKLYSQDVVSREPQDSPFAGETKGLAAVLENSSSFMPRLKNL